MSFCFQMETVLPVALQHLVVIILLFSSLFKADQKKTPKKPKTHKQPQTNKTTPNQKNPIPKQTPQTEIWKQAKVEKQIQAGKYPLSLFQFCPLPLYIWGGSCLCACTTGYCLHHHSLLGDPFSSSLLSKPSALIGKWLIQCGGELMVSPRF